METCRNTSRTTLIQIDLNSSVSIPMCLVCVYFRCQLSDIVTGICYFHSCNVIHGDLKGVRDRLKSRFITVLTANQPNILVDESGRARIADFGLAMVARSLDPMWLASLQPSHTPRWTAPEVLSGGRFTREADIFSLAMVMIEAGVG